MRTERQFRVRGGDLNGHSVRVIGNKYEYSGRSGARSAVEDSVPKERAEWRVHARGRSGFALTRHQRPCGPWLPTSNGWASGVPSAIESSGSTAPAPLPSQALVSKGGIATTRCDGP